MRILGMRFIVRRLTGPKHRLWRSRETEEVMGRGSRILMSFIVTALFCQALSEHLDERENDKLKERLEDINKRLTWPMKRLVFVDECSTLEQKCHPLQHCCGDLKCKYEKFFPPTGKCRVKISG